MDSRPASLMPRQKHSSDRRSLFVSYRALRANRPPGDRGRPQHQANAGLVSKSRGHSPGTEREGSHCCRCPSMRTNGLLDTLTTLLLFPPFPPLLQYAQCVQRLTFEDGDANSISEVHVRPEGWLSLNGRPYQRVIDPDSPYATDFSNAPPPNTVPPTTKYVMPMLWEVRQSETCFRCNST